MEVIAIILSLGDSDGVYGIHSKLMRSVGSVTGSIPSEAIF